MLHLKETLIAEKLSLQRALGHRNTDLGVNPALPLAGYITLTKSLSMRPGKGDPLRDRALFSLTRPPPPLLQTCPRPALSYSLANSSDLGLLPSLDPTLSVHMCGAHKAQIQEDIHTHRPDMAFGTRHGGHFPGEPLLTLLTGSHPTLAHICSSTSDMCPQSLPTP